MLSQLLLLAGCTKTGPQLTEVRGKVTFRGAPVSQGTVCFQPATRGGTSRPAVAVISEDGSYELHAFPGRSGALPGEYRVSVDCHTGSFINHDVNYLVPKRYADPATSSLTASVPADKSVVDCDFALVD
jgi:hypothetical protein